MFRLLARLPVRAGVLLRRVALIGPATLRAHETAQRCRQGRPILVGLLAEECNVRVGLHLFVAVRLLHRLHLSTNLHDLLSRVAAEFMPIPGVVLKVALIGGFLLERCFKGTW
eukprot:Skav201679  [mRNA]  locus=scaffold641:446414:453030:+ [translate_table: standard]